MGPLGAQRASQQQSTLGTPDEGLLFLGPLPHVPQTPLSQS